MDASSSKAFARLRKEVHLRLIRCLDLAGEHIQSFDGFVQHGIEEIIRTLPPAIAYSNSGHVLALHCANPVLLTPRVEIARAPPRALLPDECQRRTTGYCGILLVDVHIKKFLQVPDLPLFKRRTIPHRDKKFDPSDCRLRYFSELSLVDQEREAASRLISYTIHRRVRLVRVPVMSFSAACNLTYGLGGHQPRQDLGGTFLVRGAPKIIPALGRIAWNSIFVFPNTKCLALAEIRCAGFSRRFFSTTNVTLKLADAKKKTPTFGISITATLQFIAKAIPVATLLLALGWRLDAFKRAILSIRHGAQIPDLDFKLQALYAVLPDNCTVQEARMRLASYNTKSRTAIVTPEKLEATAKYILERSVFPNIDSFDAKGLLLARGVVRLFATTCQPPLQPFDERDHLAFKRFDTVGVLWTTLLRQVLNNSMDMLGKQMEKNLNKDKVHSSHDLVALIDINAVSKRVALALSTGQWSASRMYQPASRKNVCQPLQTQSFLAITSHFSRVSASVTNENKQSSMRQVQTSGFGFIDPIESPDGKSCGLVSHFCFGVRVSTATDPAAVLRALQPFLQDLNFVSVDNWEQIDSLQLCKTLFPVCLDDAHLGWVSQPQRFVDTIKALRRLRHLSPEISISTEHDEIKILCCAGRLLRPLLVIDATTCNGWSALGMEFEWSPDAVDLTDLELRGLIEFVDAAECRNLVIALSPDDLAERLGVLPSLVFTHMEIDATMMFGVSSALIPYINHNQVTRGSLESAMAKQGIDAYKPMISQSTQHMLDYPQSMLVTTDMAAVAAGLTNLRGQCCVFVLFPCAYDQEDSCQVNKASHERGLFTTVRERIDRDQQHNQGSVVAAETFEKPDPTKTVGMQYSPVEQLMDNGLARLGIVVNSGDILIGKTTTLKTKRGEAKDAENKTKRCSSLIYQGNPAVVSAVSRESTLTGEQVSKVETRQVRTLERGDKLDLRHAQKVTVAMLVSQEDLPWSMITGVAPDLVVHSAAVLGRRTIGVMLEGLASKVIALRPSQARKLGLHNATAFACDDRFYEQTLIGLLLRDEWPEELDELLGETRTDKSQGDDSFLSFPACGREPYMSGTTGRTIEGMVFTGLCHVQKLLHFAADKIYAAFTAQKTLLLRYRGGRADLGGLRVGSMEVDVLAAYGVSFILQESLVTLAEPCTLFFCKHCGLMCTVDTESQSYCTACGKQNVALRIEAVHLIKQLLFEVAHLGILIRLELETVPPH